MASKLTSPNTTETRVNIWWSNGIFFVLVHLAAAIGVYVRPWHAVPRATLALAFAVWQLADFGITVGYHRLYSHRAFRASFGTRLVLAALGSAGFQGSIKWWCLRHRLHHRFTDDPVHDPYAATRGLFYSHMGWIFFKPSYARLPLVDREDLDRDPVVRFQHKYYVALAVIFGFVTPTCVGWLWNDPLGAFIWGGLASRIAIWHCTFLVNSLAHWDGLQPYSDDNTSRGNLLLALLTGGEGNHNFHHSFPNDFRSGPSVLDWDPSKWIILFLSQFGCAYGLRRVRELDLKEATNHMSEKSHTKVLSEAEDPIVWTGELWRQGELDNYLKDGSKCVVLIDSFVVDVTDYLAEHPGGASLLRGYSVSRHSNKSIERAADATWAFDGGLNNHSRAAKRRMRGLTIARYLSD